jgi:predicted membrane-bound mannosyltransferase
MTPGGRKTTAAWGYLLAATALCGWLIETHRGVRWAAVVITLIASSKVYVIMSRFMKLDVAPLFWRAAAGVWLLIATAVILPGF